MELSTKAKFGIFMALLTTCVLVIGMVIAWPLAVLWAINVLFSCSFPFTFKYWLSIVILILTAASLCQIGQAKIK